MKLKIEISANFGDLFSQGRGGTLETPWRCNSVMTPSTDGGFSPKGSGSHGFVITSPIAASMLSFDCNRQVMKQCYHIEQSYSNFYFGLCHNHNLINKIETKKGALTGWMSMGWLVGPNCLVGTPMLEWFDDAIPYPYTYIHIEP